MKLFKLVLVSLVLLVGSYSAVAEDLIKTIEVDSITGEPKEVLPFDEAFILKIKTTADPEFVLLYQLSFFEKRYADGRLCDRTLKDKVELAEKLQGAQKAPIEIPKSHIWRNKEYLYIRFDQINNNDIDHNAYLKPSKDYRIVIPVVDPLVIKFYEHLQAYSVSGLRNDLGKAFLVYSKIVRKQKEEYGIPFLTDDTFFFTAAELQLRKTNPQLIPQNLSEITDIYNNYYLPKVQADYMNYDRAVQRVKAIDNAGCTNTLKGVAALKKLIAFYSSKKTDKELCLDINCIEFTGWIEAFYSLDDSCINKLLLGYGTLGDELCSVNAIPESYNKRIANLKKTKKLLTSFKNNLGTLSFYGLEGVTKTTIETEIDNWLAGIKILNTELENIVNNRKKLLTLPAGPDRPGGFLFNAFSNFDEVGLSTYVRDFDQRSKLQITPELGMVYSGFTEGLNYLSPYAGFHINFRYLKKNMPLRRLPNFKWYHRFSFMMGYTLVSIAEDGKRADFFKDRSMLTGFGFRLTNGLRIVGGAHWFNQISPNPVLNTKSLTVMPYFGVSIDLDLKKLINGFETLTLNR